MTLLKLPPLCDLSSTVPRYASWQYDHLHLLAITARAMFLPLPVEHKGLPQDIERARWRIFAVGM